MDSTGHMRIDLPPRAQHRLDLERSIGIAKALKKGSEKENEFAVRHNGALLLPQFALSFETPSGSFEGDVLKSL